jgi:simple sugar transport system permease protein
MFNKADNHNIELEFKKQRRAETLTAAGSSIGAVILALIIGAVIIRLLGVNPFDAYRALIDGAFGTKNSIAETLLRAVPLAITGIGITAAFRASIFNVGAEGQLYLGATSAVCVGLAFPTLHPAILLPLMAIAGMITGALWGGIAVLLKLKFNANEMINTIMMNYIAIYFVSWLVHGPIQQPGSPLGQTAGLSDNAILPIILKQTRLHIGFIFTLLMVLLTGFLIYRTVWGYQIRVTGKNMFASQAAGIKVKWVFLSSMLFSGAMAGLAGFFEAAGIQHRMIENISSGYGYTAIVVALLGQLNPFGVLLAAILFGGLQIGASTMETAVGVPASAVTLIQYLIVILFIGRKAFSLIIQQMKKNRKVAA